MKRFYTADEIQQFAQGLRNTPAPPKNEFSPKETFELLKGEIESLRQRGFSLKQIVDAMNGVGLEISTPTLKKYMQIPKEAKRKKTTPKEGARRIPPPQPTEPAGSAFTLRPDTENL